MNTKCSYDLILEGQFEEAIVVAERNFAENKQLSEKYNSVLALLNMKRKMEALEVCKGLYELNTESYKQLLGLCYWLTNQRELAITNWKNDLAGKRVDEFGGLGSVLLLYYAGVVIDDMSLTDFSLKQAKKIHKKWSSFLSSYMLDFIDETEALKQSKKDKGLSSRNLCKLYFHIALQRKRTGLENEFRVYLKKMKYLSGNCRIEPEYYLTMYELDNAGV